MRRGLVWSGVCVIGLLTACGAQQAVESTSSEIIAAAEEEPPPQREPEVVATAITYDSSPPPAQTPDPAVRLSVPPPSDAGKAIVVDQRQQVMALYEDGVEVRRMPISTGRPTYATYTLAWNGYVGRYWGTFQSYTGGRADNAWYLYEASGSILIHGAPYYVVDGEKQYYDLEALGNYPSSAGCIRLHPDDAQWFTDWNPLNAAIRITEWPGEIAGLLGEQLPY